MDLILQPVRIATGKPARQTYLTTILLLSTSLALLGAATIAYVLFYVNFLPQIGIERLAHLQYGDGRNPYAFISLSSELVSQQAYTVTAQITLPRSPANLEAGNFMLDLALLSPTYKPAALIPQHQAYEAGSSVISTLAHAPIPAEAILFSIRRPALLTYRSPLMSLARQVLSLPWHVFSVHRDAETLTIPMTESSGVTFGRGRRNVPTTAFLEVQGVGQHLQVYDVKLFLQAHFTGIRWLMYNYRVASFVAFTAAFWAVECVFMLLAFFVLHARSNLGSETSKPAVKQEDVASANEGSVNGTIKTEAQDADGAVDTDDPDLSDTPRSFPTYGRQAPLRYAPTVKQEEKEAESILEETRIQPLEADDESEEINDSATGRRGGGRSDSGLGTSFSEGGASTKASLSRRRGSRTLR